MATLAVVGASPLFRAGLVSLLKTLDFDHVQEGADLKELKGLEKGAGCPEILLAKTSGTAEDISNFMGEARSWIPEIKVVFLASELKIDLLISCFAAGANGFLLENISRDAFQESLRLVFAGEKVFPSGMAALISGLASKNGGVAVDLSDLRNFQLSDREIDILRCLSIGQSNKVIANTLHIAESTVKVHVKRILQKTHATNRTQAALWGAARGLAPTSSPMPGEDVKESNRATWPREQESRKLVPGVATRSVGVSSTERPVRSQTPHRHTLPRSS
jgi:two-component system nitrate/nitrite response regulator NarL